MKRILTSLAGIFLTFYLISPVQAFTVSGGTQSQRALIREAIMAAEVPPYEWTDQHFIGGVNIELVEHFEPMWSEPLSFDILQGAIGAAWAGEIRIMSTIDPGPYLTEVAIHEWAHQVWFVLPAAANKEWTALATEDYPGYDPRVWMQNPAENHSENLRVVAWDNQWYLTQTPRTYLKRFTDAFVRDWHDKWTGLVSPPGEPPASTTTTTTGTPTKTVPPFGGPTTTTTTLPPPTTTTTVAPPPTTTTTTMRGDPWPDVTRDDPELWEAAWWAKDDFVFFGYTDGFFHPHNFLTHRQLALITDRWMGIALPQEYLHDYTPVTRRETREELPGLTWLEERDDEPLTRSQLLRLMWRAR